MEKFSSYPRLKNAAVLAKIDAITYDFYDTTFRYVLEDFLKLKLDFKDTFFQSVFKCAESGAEFIGYTYQHISISCRRYELTNGYEALQNDLHPFFQTFSVVRLKISGQGLTYLRSLGFDPEVEFRKFPECRTISEGGDLVPMWKPTRVDFAFDFINYNGDFYDTCYDYLYPIWCEKFAAGLVPKVTTCGKGSAYQFELKTTQRTINIGCRGNRMLRIYDKLYERKCKCAAFDPAETGGIGLSDINTWIRLEFECHRHHAHDMLYGEGDYLSILKFIQKTFRFYDPAKRLPVPFWDKLFNSEEIAEFIQNANWVERIETAADIIWTVPTFINLTAYIVVYGWESLRALLQAQIDQDLMGHDVRSVYRRKKLLSKISILQGGACNSKEWQGARMEKLPDYDNFLLRFNELISDISIEGV